MSFYAPNVGLVVKETGTYFLVRGNKFRYSTIAKAIKITKEQYILHFAINVVSLWNLNIVIQ